MLFPPSMPALRSLVPSAVPAFWFAAAAAAAGGCSSAPGPAEDIGTTSAAISTGDILSRAQQWVNAQLLYCQSPNGADDSIDPSCPSTCVRQSNSEWDPYRSDCSGFISWAWGLPPPGLTTEGFAPADTTYSTVIQGMDLQPGDALNIPGDHIVLFVSWITVGSEASFYEEPGCSASPNYAHAFSSNVEINGSDVTIDYEGNTFTAIRFTQAILGGDAGPMDAGAINEDSGVACSVGGFSGECLDTSVCASMGGMSTPNYCPGPDNIQCCTAFPVDSGVAPTVDAAAPPVDGGSGSTEDAGVGGGTGTPEGSGTGSPGSGTGAVLGTGPGSGGPPGAGATADAGSGFVPPLGSPAGCSASGTRNADGTWLFGLGLGFVARSARSSRRRRRCSPRSAR
jgi:hypothetical protein